MANFPIIHIIGLPGAGKTTLAHRLGKRFKLPIYKIGDYRSKFPASPLGEADTWVSLFCTLSKRKWKNCILETTGLNRRESFLKDIMPLTRILTIKLEAKRKILYERIKKKNKSEQGGNWLFSKDYHDKYEFVRKLFKEFRKLPATFKIDTIPKTPREVYDIVLERLKPYLEFDIEMIE